MRAAPSLFAVGSFAALAALAPESLLPLTAVAAVTAGAVAAGRPGLGAGLVGALLAASHAAGGAALGLSFACFQAMSLLLDRTRTGPVGAIAYVSFFPSLLAGPIARAGALLPQLERPASATPERVGAALTSIARGVVWKVAVSDVLGPYAEAAATAPDAPGAVTWTGAACYGFRIYADLQAWTSIARGLAGLVGVELPANFDAPFAARDPAAFWRRWHVTVSAWFRDYVLSPLLARTPAPLAILVTFLLVGAWHGATANHLLFGAWHGGWVLAAVAWRRWRPDGTPLGTVVTWFAVLVPAVFFLVDPTPGAAVGHLLAPPWEAGPDTPASLRALLVPTAIGVVWGAAIQLADRATVGTAARWFGRAATWSLAAAVAVALPPTTRLDFLYFAAAACYPGTWSPA